MPASLLHRVQPATRLLKTHQGYVSLVSGVLALAIGVNLLVFSIVDALWLRPLPVVDPARVVTILGYSSTVKSLDVPRLQIFGGPVAGQIVTTGYSEAFTPHITFSEAAAPLETLGVTPSYFTVLGVPIRGRAFADADERAGAEAVAIISDRLWARAFGRRPDVIGSVIAAAPRPLRIVGIAPPGFEGARRGERADLWVPTQVVRDLAPDERQMDAPNLMLFARLRPGENVAALEQRYRAQLTQPDGSAMPSAIAPTFARLTDVYGTSDSPSIVIRERGTLAVVSGLSLLVLLGGCATIATLVLTHYERRRPELAIKAALGASHGRLVRELAVELLAVGVAGSAGAIVCGLLAVRALPALSLPGGVNIGRLDLSVDWPWCAMAFAAALVTLTAAGAVPLWKTTHGRLAAEISTAPATAPRGALRVRRRLLALQVCATTVVLLASGLLVRTVLYSFRTGAGFDIDRTVFVTVQEKPLRTTLSTTPGVSAIPAGLARQAQLRGLLEQVPSVRAVAGGMPPISAEALRSVSNPRTIRIAGRDEKLLVGVLSGTPNLLSALGVPLLAGRALDRSDDISASPMPVVITRSLADRLWASGDALGQTMSMPELRGGRYLVVGIAEDFAFGTLTRPMAGVMVTANGDPTFIDSNMVLQTDDPRSVVAALPKWLAGRVVRAATGREIVGRDISQQRLGAWAFSGFGLVALLLGIGGVFGLVAYLAQSRRREFGVRMALGATLADVVRNAVRAALGPVAVGLAAGLLIGGLVSRVLSAWLVGIDRLDPGTYAIVGFIMLVPATLAALAAAWRLRRLTPSEALRNS